MPALEAKIVILGAQGVGKTSLVQRYCSGTFDPSQMTSTVGASFVTKRVFDADTDTTVRLQIWDTAGQERFRSISRLYYRGANACILCYSITDFQSFLDMGAWLAELRRNLPGDVVLHVVGTKADIVARDPTARRVPFERCIAYVAENLAPGQGSTPPPTAISPGMEYYTGATPTPATGASSLPGISFMAASPSGPTGLAPHARSPSSNRSSGFWGQEAGWDACHEISAESGEGVEEVFRVVARKLVEQNRKITQAVLTATATLGTPGYEHGMDGGYFGAQPEEEGTNTGGGSGGVGGIMSGGSFRLPKDRRSWFSPGFVGPGDGGSGAGANTGGGGMGLAGMGSALDGRVNIAAHEGYEPLNADGGGRRCC